ncbi:hypothetical protein M409DRAFT_27466 [Zasmidium cellare ATCC 36951]|uniref:Hydrophobic surface binding protein A n=1 Tax=Zasmidium cellare ATCC 36951 TaxID=1080233 RepID=A0A6A6C8X1_ZASCE|nr:uncharacterized protein M409DRAFT_27466 [Zasmidium cellare ATCC 36951]KAF2162089.1 hypothetical protein M409DRAFT_27466 [Zasmidium cellare ATCC 36951]
MKLLSAILVTAALATATPLTARDELITAQTLISDISNINAGVESLRKDVAAYDGSLLSETRLVADFTAIHLANRKGFLDANLRQAPFNASDSHDIVQFTIDSVGVSIPAAVEETKAKKALFEKSGQDAVIAGTLKVLLNDHDTFSAPLVAKLTADLERGQAVVAKIHDSIQSGIDYFSS